MPQGHDAVGGVWKDAQMVFPSLSLAIAIYRGEATNPSFVVNVVDPVRCGRPIVRNDIGHVHQVAMPKFSDVLVNGKNWGVL